MIEVRAQHAMYAVTPRARGELDAEVDSENGMYCMRRCTTCGLEFAEPMRPPGERWYEVLYNAMPLYPETRWEYGEVLTSLQPGDRVFEFGAGAGQFLLECGKRGIAARGAEFARSSVGVCREKGLTVDQCDISSAMPPMQMRPSQIVAFHVLEHLANPLDLFARAAEISSPDSWLWIAVPSDLRPSRLMSQPDMLDQPPHHLTRWTAQALGTCGAMEGWKLVRLSREPVAMRASLWAIATQMRVYQALQRQGLLALRLLERCARWMLYPVALLMRLGRHRNMSGFSMLACYKRR